MPENTITRRTKILATLGPASASLAGVAELIAAGADGFRLNASHLAPEQIAPLVTLVREAEGAVGRPIAVLVDLAGPKLRVLKGLAASIVADGEVVTLGTAASGARVPIEGFDPARECAVGSRILVHDGKVLLRVSEVAVDHVSARVERGGDVAGGMGVNLPDSSTTLPSLTEHDHRCLAAALAAGADIVALSFVRRAGDIVAVREAMRAAGAAVPVVAKLEKAQAVETVSLPGILAATDMVMVARGDLGAETSPEQVPVLQKRILQASRAIGVPAITATEMLESMIREVRPTRAEAADVANAVYDGSDVVMLSAETAVGAHPALVVRTCAGIVRQAEAHAEFRTPWSADSELPEVHDPLADAVAAAAGHAARQISAALIVCFTSSGRTARLVARHRPTTPILALTPNERVAGALALVWGVTPRHCPERPGEHEGVVALAEREARRSGLAREGDVIVVTHGAPVSAQSATNLLRIHRL